MCTYRERPLCLHLHLNVKFIFRSMFSKSINEFLIKVSDRPSKHSSNYNNKLNFIIDRTFIRPKYKSTKRRANICFTSNCKIRTHENA